eukprot:gene3347-2329_t
MLVIEIVDYCGLDVFIVMGSLGWMSVGGLTLSYRLVYCMYFRCCDLLVCDIGCMYNFGFTGVSGLKISSRLIVGVDYYYMCMRWWIYNINLFAVTSQIQFLRVGDALRFGGLLVHFIGIYSIVGGFSPDLFVDRFIVKVVTYVMNWFVAMSLFYGCSACEKDLRDFLDSIVACMLILDASLHVHEFVGGWEAFCKGFGLKIVWFMWLFYRCSLMLLVAFGVLHVVLIVAYSVWGFRWMCCVAFGFVQVCMMQLQRCFMGCLYLIMFSLQVVWVFVLYCGFWLREFGLLNLLRVTFAVGLGLVGCCVLTLMGHLIWLTVSIIVLHVTYKLSKGRLSYLSLESAMILCRTASLLVGFIGSMEFLCTYDFYCFQLDLFRCNAPIVFGLRGLIVFGTVIFVLLNMHDLVLFNLGWCTWICDFVFTAECALFDCGRYIYFRCRMRVCCGSGMIRDAVRLTLMLDEHLFLCLVGLDLFANNAD